jgi:putative DNA primase/helicase
VTTMSPIFETTTFRKAGGGLLSKRISLRADGILNSDPSSCHMTNGEAWRVQHAGLAEFAGYLNHFQSCEAVALGALAAGLPDPVKITTKAALARMNGYAGADVIARDGRSITFRPDTPALVLLDHDTGGMPEVVRAEIARRGGFWSTLVSVMPELAEAGHVLRASTSTGISRLDTGMTFPGSGGLHAYVLVQDGSDIPRFLRRLYDACWLAGLGWFNYDKNGKLLERSIVDLRVGDPSRLVFEGPPELVPPLVQAPRPAEFYDGGLVDTQALPPLSEAQQGRLDDLRAAAREWYEGPKPHGPKPRTANTASTPRAIRRPTVPRAGDDDLTPLRDALRANAVAVTEALLGQCNKMVSSRTTHRWGTKGSLAVEVAGAKCGMWFDHEAGEGGDLLDLIRRTRGGTFADTLAWACDFTGISVPSPEPSVPEPDAPSQPEPSPEEPESEAPETETESSEPESETEPPPDEPGPGTEPPPESETDEPDTEDAADQAERIASAQRLAATSQPLTGSLGEYYLKQTRGIPPPPAGWPDPTRWHPRYRALLAVATLPDGTVRAVQRIHLNHDGEKIDAEEMTQRRLPGVKVTNGIRAGAAVRLPGNAMEPLLLVEGVETGLAVHAATGFETWCALGGVAALALPTDRRVLVCADDDPPARNAKQGGAAKKLREAVRKWRRQGVDVTVVCPWPVRRHDKSDFADVILGDGAAAVQARLRMALEPDGPTLVRHPLSEARTLLGEAVGRFFAAGASDPGEPPLVHAVRVDTAVGKSRNARQLAADTLAAMRKNGDKRTIVIAVPRHALGDEQARSFNALEAAQAAGLTAAVWRGRDARDPDFLDAEPPALMCQEHDRVKDAQAALADIEKSCCRQRKVQRPDGTTGDVTCRAYETCAYQNQKRCRADVWFVPHQLLCGEKPSAIVDPAFVIVDESSWAAGLEGVHGQPWRLSFDALAERTQVYPDGSSLNRLETDHLGFLRGVLRDALVAMPDGPLTRVLLAATLLTPESCAEAIRLEWSAKVDAKMHPGMSRQERKERRDAVQANRLIPTRVALWRAVRALLVAGGPDASGWAAALTMGGDDGLQRVLGLTGRREIKEGWQVPTLLLDATLPLELNRCYWPDVRLAADIRAEASHQHIRQVIDRTYAASRFILTAADDSPLDPKEVQRCANRLRELRAVLIREARPYVARGVLVVLQKKVEAALLRLGPLPAHIETAHHNDVAGLDRWRGVGLLIVVGRTEPSPSAVEQLAEAITGRAVQRLDGWYGRRDAVRLMVSGRHVLAEADFHPNPVAEAVRWQICEGELVQIIGRARGVIRDETNPVDILVMTDVVLPVPVDAVIDDDLKPSPADMMLAEGGVAVVNPDDAAAIYPNLWPTRDAAKDAIQRDRCGTKGPLLGHSPISILCIYIIYRGMPQ